MLSEGLHSFAHTNKIKRRFHAFHMNGAVSSVSRHGRTVAASAGNHRAHSATLCSAPSSPWLSAYSGLGGSTRAGSFSTRPALRRKRAHAASTSAHRYGAPISCAPPAAPAAASCAPARRDDRVSSQRRSSWWQLGQSGLAEADGPDGGTRVPSPLTLK